MKEITLSKRNILLILLIALLTGGGIFWIQHISRQSSGVASTPSLEEAEITRAAVAGTQAFFQISAGEGREAWLARFCAESTENGCALVRQGADGLWQKVQAAKTEVQAQVQALECVSTTDREQVWRVAITLSESLPGSNKSEDEAYVLVVQTDGGWKFERFLLEPEIQVLIERQQKEVHQ